MTAETEPIAAGAVVTSEYERQDYNTFAFLAGRRSPVAILSETTRGRPERSAHYNEFLAPFGTPHEMRAALVTRRRAWGCVVMHRTADTGDFTPDDAQVIARLSRPIAEAFRQSLRFDAGRRCDDARAPGMVVLDADDAIRLMTPTAPPLLEPMLAAEAVARDVPVPLLTLASEARRLWLTGRLPGPLHVPTRSGWITLHASLPDEGRTGQVAIVLQDTREDHAAPLRLEIFGLTAREREVASLVARGFDTKSIAERLFISPWTVQDHLKVVFHKTGTNSRHELRSTVFFHDHLPAIVRRQPLDAHGHLSDLTSLPRVAE